MLFPSLFGGVGGDLALPQSASSNSASGFTGGGVTIEGLKLGNGLDDSTLLIIAAGALIVLFFVGRK